MLKIGVLASGGGTNLQVIIDSIKKGYITNCSIAVVISNKKNAYALERARNNGIESVYIPKKDKTVEEYDRLLVERLEAYDVELVVLAGFICIMGERFTERFKNKVINVHPSLIPSFCGKGYYGIIPHEKALEYGVKVSGATVHFAELQADAGPIILQKAVEVKPDDTPEVLQQRVMREAEWIILPEAVNLIANGRVKIEGRKVYITDFGGI